MKILILAALLLCIIASRPLCRESPQAQSAPPPSNVIQVRGFEDNAGQINCVQGDVKIIRPRGDVQTPRVPMQLDDGDVVKTSSRSRTEILMIPGVFLRLDQNTRCVLSDLKIDNQKIELSAGRVIIEVLMFEPGLDRKAIAYDPIRIVTPHALCTLANGGLFDLTVNAEQTSIVAVKGVLQIGGRELREGQRAIAQGPAPVNLTSQQYFGDDFSSWSSERSQLISAANAAVKKEPWQKLLGRADVFVTSNQRRTKEPAQYYVASTKDAGHLTFAESVTLYKRGSRDWMPVTAPMELESGDRIRTGPGAHAEVIVNWAALARLGGQTEIMYSKSSDAAALLTVITGSVILSWYSNAADPVDISTPAVTFSVLPKGRDRVGRAFYRVNCNDAATEIVVRFGTIRLSHKERSGPARIVIAGEALKQHSLDLSRWDELDSWHWRRKYGTAQIGIWYYSKLIGAYTFIAGDGSFRSPYGGRYPVKLHSLLGSRR